MLVYEIKKDTEQFECARHNFEWHLPFYSDEFKKDFEEVIGVSIQKNLGVASNALFLTVIPESTREQFKKHKNNGYYEAKMSSKLNKAFLELIKKYKISRPYPLSFALQLPYLNCLDSSYSLKGRYFIQIKDAYNKEEYIEKLDKVKYLQRVKSSEFLELYAEVQKADEVS